MSNHVLMMLMTRFAYPILVSLLFIVGVAPEGQSKNHSSVLPSVQPSIVIHHPKPRLLDGFGMSVSQHQDQILVGAPNAMHEGRETGLAYLFDREGNLDHTFQIPVVAPGALFGQTLVLSSQNVIIGAPHGPDKYKTQTGVVYLFNRNTKKVRLTLNNPQPTSGVFGHAIAVGGQHVLVGDPQASSATSFHGGAVYLFDEVTGVLKQTFRPVPMNAPRPTQFGQAVGLVGHRIFVSAPFGGADGSEAGIVYLFDEKTGNLVRTFEPPNDTRSLYFGWSFVANEHVILIGAFGFQGTYREEGIAYLYDVQSGKLLKTLSNPSPTERARFGKSVALLQGALVVSAPGDRIQENGKIKGGVVYLFHVVSGTLLATLQEPFRMTGASDVFGDSLFVDDHALLVGAPFGGTGGELDAGLVYQFQIQKP